MPKNSRHKSHKQSKHSSKDYSDSEEDVIKVKDKNSKDDISTRARRDSTSGDKRKFSSQVPEAKGTKDLAGDGHGEIVEEYVSSKRRKGKEKTDVIVGVDRWIGGGDDRGDSDRTAEKETHKLDSLKVGNKLKENSNKGENLRNDAKSKSKRYESGPDERKEDTLASVLVEKGEGKSRGDSKRRSERDGFTPKEGKELKDKDRRLDKERNGDEEIKGGDANRHVKNKITQVADFSDGRQGKRLREIAEETLHDELQSTELEKGTEKRIRRKGEGTGEREKHYHDSKEGDGRRLSSRVDRAKDSKYKDDKHNDGVYEDKYLEDGYKDERRRDDKYREEADKDSKYHDDKYQEDADKDSKYHDDKYRDGDKSIKRRSERHRDEGARDGRRRDEKYRDDGEQDSRRKDDKYREGVEREGRRDDKYEKYRDDGDRDRKRKDGRYLEDGDKDFSRGDEKYRDGGDKDDRRRDSSYRDESNRDSRHKEEKYQEDIERDSQPKDSKQGDERDREKRSRDPKYRDERPSRDHSSYKSDHKHTKEDGNAVDHSTSRNAYGDSPIHDDRVTSYRRTNEKDDYGDNRSRGIKNQRSDTERMSSGGAKIKPTTERARVQKQDESRYGDYNYERTRQVMSSTIDPTITLGISDKSSQMLEKLSKKDDGNLGGPSAERRLKSDIRPSSSQQVDKSPSSSIDRRQQLGRPDARRSLDVEESTPKSGGSRDRREYSGMESRVKRELSMDVLPGEEPLQSDADTLSVSSPFVRNNHFPYSSKSLAPPPSRTGLSSPSLSGSAEDEGRGKSNMRHRRSGDPSIGRIQGNAWGGIPGWPSPVANGFLPFPPHVNFSSVIQPFPAPPMFGVRPSMEFDHPTPYHMPDADRFPGPIRPVVWGHQIDNSGPPLHSWDSSIPGFGLESNIYGRSDWDHTRNLPGDRVGETSANVWRGSNRTGSMELLYSEKENDSTRSAEVLADSSNQPNELTQCNQLEENKEVGQLTKISEKNDTEATITSLEDSSDVTKLSRNDDVRLCRAYMSKIDISADLSEPGLYNECAGLIDMDQSISVGVDDYRILSTEDEESKTASHGVLSNTLFASIDDSIFENSMSLYRRQKVKSLSICCEEKLLTERIPISNTEDHGGVDDKTEKVYPENLQDHLENMLQTANTADPSTEVLSAKDINMEPDAVLGLALQDFDTDKPVTAAGIEVYYTLPKPVKLDDAPVEPTCNNEEVKVLDTKCDSMLNNSDVLSEAMLPESIMSEPDNLSRIHLSPGSNH